ncbi:LysR family transcriptional regulator [Rhodococcus sp. BP-252]|uniref:LysR family transcriptional regulator n=1 Tax=Rhodococcoides kyotonense TaxID=398843 RepID=A0A177Y6W1_9NOCA|nr:MULTISPECIES: LysR family transcriptional regulator [Rhodococcus]MBY6410298.1 LysR family transcriptional regulator [Rhodococcus sp. BP-320]MBY6416180.1 LysR family transcriptional regulator [Rhodococcus sp. BP-321]MBY6420175.1 LysR family transcriptional regulator [Rhodococcus sp. BP-324]MBY6424854.1 LysR family transcriptional regulator [Rhodococcus sp. BP-323]MBY6430440.1 LysR family transcriptional regulator [Rhodococcus sp. BP-322]
MELRHLEYFVAVADERNFTRAAGRLHIVQSAVSAAIKALERELGATLLDRNSKRVLLTDAGAALLPRARAVLEAARSAREVVDEVNGGLRGSLRIGIIGSITLYDLPKLLGHYHRRYPRVRLLTRAAPSGTQGLLEAVADGSLDLAFVSQPEERPAGVVLRSLAFSVLDLVIPHEYVLDGSNGASIADLAGLDFIDAPVGYGTRTVIDRAFDHAGIQRRVSIEITDLATGVDYVRHGLGVALLPRYILDAVIDLPVVPVVDADLTLALSVATSAVRPTTTAVEALLELVEDTERAT